MKFILNTIAIIFLIFQYVSSKNCSYMAEKGYCTNFLYRQMMCSSCKNECADKEPACVVPEKDSSCKDLIKDCDSKVYLCNMNSYKKIMSKSCPSTCGICNGNKKTTTTKPTNTTIASSSKSTKTTTKI